VPGVRLFLAANNLVFQTLLYRLQVTNGKVSFDTQDYDEKPILIENVQPASFQKMLQAIYWYFSSLFFVSWLSFYSFAFHLNAATMWK
jgi:hypothetical protein